MLQKIGFLPGFNKQVTPTTAEGQWIAGDNVRFRYSTPEKIGGWAELGESYLTGATRALHHFVDNTGIKYAALGTNRILYVYSGGIFYDIHPIKTTTTLTSAFSTVGTSPGPATAAVTITFGSAHGMSAGDIVYLDNPRNEAQENDLFVDNNVILDRGLHPILLGKNLITEIHDIALKYKHNCDVSRIECKSLWK